MYAPHSLTWYEGRLVNNAQTYTRHEINEVMWQASKATNVASEYEAKAVAAAIERYLGLSGLLFRGVA